MNISPRILRETASVGVGLAYAVILVMMLFNVQGRISIESTDTFTYADTARQIARGQGISTKIIQPFVSAPAMPQVTWPPFFPLVVAVPLAFGASVVQAMMTTPVIVLALSCAIFLWAVVRRWGVLPAVLFSAFSLTAAPLLHVAAQPMTEAVFMGLSLVTVVLIWELLERPKTHGALFLAIGLGLTLASLGLLRYLGFAMVPGVGLLLLLLRRKRELVTMLIAAGLVAVPFLARNFLVFHQYSNERFPTDAGLFLNIQDAFVGIGKDFLHYLMWPSIRAAAVLAVLALVYAWARPRLAGRISSSLTFGWIPVYLAVVYLAGMIATRTLFFFDKLNTPRFEAPVEWLALAGVSIVAAACIGRVRWLAWVFGAVILITAIRTVPSLYRTPRHDRLPVSGRQVQWVRENVPLDALILSNHGHSYNFFLGHSVVALRQYREPKDAAELLDWRRNWDSAFREVYLIINPDLDPVRHTDFIVALSKGELSFEWLQPLPDAPSSIRAYRIQ